jgi:hypothetical protein
MARWAWQSTLAVSGGFVVVGAVMDWFSINGQGVSMACRVGHPRDLLGDHGTVHTMVGQTARLHRGNLRAHRVGDSRSWTASPSGVRIGMGRSSAPGRFRTGLLVVVAGAVLAYVAGVIRDATEPERESSS